MDSGNSGSLQSSSGGDEEYDSRAADSISAFMSIHPTNHVGSISNPPPPSTLFDPLSNYLQLQNPNSSLLNSNMLWPRSNSSLRSDPNPTHDIINPMPSSSNPFMNSFQAPAAVGIDNNNNSNVTVPLAQNPAPAARNPKKRSRASRRAPTTVLTTDTTNFRAMVQEFTGIPAPPFNNSPFSRNRLDLFSTRSTTMDSTQPPPYLRRPFAQKVQSPMSFLGSASSSLSSSALDAAIAASTTTNNNNIITSVSSSTIAAASNSTSSINYQLPITQSSNLFNISNPLLTSLLQSNTKFPFSSPSFLASKSLEIPSNDHHSHHSHIKMGSLDEFGLGHGTVSGLPNLISSNQNPPRNDQNNSVSPDEGNDIQQDDQMRLVNGNYNFPRNSKINYSDSSSSFHGEKGPENVTTRGEGMVESWICSSE